MKEHSKVIFLDIILFNQVGSKLLSFWNRLKSVKEQSEAVFVDNASANIQYDVENLSLFFYIHVKLCMFLSKQVPIFACMCSKLYFLCMNEQLKEKKEWKFYV